MLSKLLEYIRFPSKMVQFELHDDKDSSLARLRRRSYETKNCHSIARTNQSFKGTIQSDRFQLMVLLFGAITMCIIQGELKDKFGELNVSIHPVFQWLLLLLIFLPFIALSRAC
jgi:hypothetical protein